MWHVALMSPMQATSQRLAELDQRLAAVEAERNALLVERRALVGRHVQAATSQTLKHQIQLQRYREDVGMDWEQGTFFCVVAMWVSGDESQTQYGTCVLCACIIIFVAFHGTLNSHVSGCLMHSNWFQQMKSVAKRGARWAASSFIKKRREGYSVAFEGSEAIPFSPIHFCPAAFDLSEFAEGSSPLLPQLSREICWFLPGSSHRPT